MVGVDAHPGARQYVSPPEIPSHEEHFEVTVAHQRWALYMGALLSPWEGYLKDGKINPDYGKAEVHDWKTLMKWIEDIREKRIQARKNREDAEDVSGHTHDREKTSEEKILKELAEADLHRPRCLAWLLNSMARNLRFNKDNAKKLIKWRLESARKVETGKRTQVTSLDIEVREAVNTLTLRSIACKVALPKAWYQTQERLNRLEKKLGTMYRGQTSKPRSAKRSSYQTMKNHQIEWVEHQLEMLKKPLSLPEAEKTDHESPCPMKMDRRLDNIINGDGTKEMRPLDKIQTRVVRDAFALAKSAKQFLMLVDGGPGTGKTETTNRLTKALKLLDMTTAYTGSTGTAATNYVNGHTLHNMMGFGLTMLRGKALASKYNHYVTREETMRRLGGGNPRKIVLVIDEISALTYDVFGTTDHALRILYDNDEPFGGISVVLVGDFDQKLPVTQGGSLAQVLVNSVTDSTRRMTAKSAQKRNVADVFGRFTKYELAINHRLVGKQPELCGMLRRMKNPDVLQPITRDFLKTLPQLERLDTMEENERDKWQFCPIMCTGNAERQRINAVKVVEFGKAKNLPILVFYDRLSNIKDPEVLNRLSRMLRLKSPIKHYFVPGAPAILTKNVRDYTHRGLVNSARAKMWSMTWNERDRNHPTVEAWYNGELEGGKEYLVPFPHAITVKMKKTGELFPVVHKNETIKISSMLASWLNLKEKIRVTTHLVDLAFAFTDYKVQGLTLDRLVIMLNEQTARHDLATLYVGISRVQRLRDLRIWPLDCDKERAIQHLVSIKRPGFIRVWRKGYDDEGRFRPKQLAYTRLKQLAEMLDALGDPDELEAKTVTKLKTLSRKCGVIPPAKKVAVVARLKRLIRELTKQTDLSRSKRKDHPLNTVEPSPPKRTKPAPRQRRGRIKLPVYPELVGESDSSDDESPTSNPASHNPSKRKHRSPDIVEPPRPKRRKQTPERRPSSDDADDKTQTPALASHNPPNAIPRSRNTNPRSRSRDRRPRARADAPPRHSSSSSQGTNPVAPMARGYVSE